MNKIVFTILVISALLRPFPVHAYTIVNAVPGVTQYVQSVSEVATGPEMAGMQVTVTGNFEGGTAIGTWTQPVFILPAYDGGVFFNGDEYSFFIFQAGDTYTNPWMLYSYYDILLYNITIEALPGNVVFDRSIDGMEKTPGSGQGMDCAAPGGFSPFPLLATYSNLVALNGQSPQGDLYSTLDVQFAFGFGQTFNDSVYYELFTADTDHMTPTPVSSSLVLLGSGLAGLMGIRKKFKR